MRRTKIFSYRCILKGVALISLLLLAIVGAWFLIKTAVWNVKLQRGLAYKYMEYEVVEHENIFPDRMMTDTCHASTICKLDNGSLICAWFGGTKEGMDDIAIWYSVKSNNGWSSPKIAADQENVPLWNPVLSNIDGHLYLFYKSGKSPVDWETYVKEYNPDSTGGWSDEHLIPDDAGLPKGPVKNKCLVLSDGTILAGSSSEEGYWHCYIDRSTDHGVTWSHSNFITIGGKEEEGRGVIQPALWEDDNGIVHCFMRSSEGWIYESESKDLGITWSKARKTGLPNNNSGIDVTRLPNGVLVLVYNPNGEVWGARSPIAFSLSYDNGRSWEEPVILEQILCDKKVNTYDVEFSYPAIISDGYDVYITYTWKRNTIAYWHLKFSEIQ